MKALVLKKIPFSESDLIVHFLLEDGRIFSGFAAGGRRSKKRFPHQFHPAGLYEIEWHRNSPSDKLTRLNRCELLKFFPVVSQDLLRFSEWALILDWIYSDKVGEFQFAEIYDLLENFEASSDRRGFYLFFLRQMKEHGLVPELESCVICSKAVQSSYRFDLIEGGISHLGCSRGVYLSASTLEFLKNALIADSGSPAEDLTETEAEDLDSILIPYLKIQLELPLKSHLFYEQIRPSTRSLVEAQ